MTEDFQLNCRIEFMVDGEPCRQSMSSTLNADAADECKIGVVGELMKLWKKNNKKSIPPQELHLYLNNKEIYTYKLEQISK